MSELANEIRSRGYWHVVVRPVQFVSGRVPYAELQPIVERSSVQSRGWSFPYIERESINRDVDWIGQESDWHHLREVWRLYTSGQYFYLAGFREDWRERSTFLPPVVNGQPGQRLGVSDAIFRFLEVYEFAARLSLTAAGGEEMNIRVTCAGLEGRTLYVDDSNRMPFTRDYTASLDKYPIECQLPRDKLVSETVHLAATAAHDLFARFGWSPSLESVQTVANQLQTK